MVAPIYTPHSILSGSEIASSVGSNERIASAIRDFEVNNEGTPIPDLSTNNSYSALQPGIAFFRSGKVVHDQVSEKVFLPQS